MGSDSDRSRSRYCYAKLVPPENNVHEMFHTYFWTPEGKSIPLAAVLGFRNFQAVPFVEVEDVFVSKAVRSMQLKLRECIVYPPAEQPSMRFSVCFPDRVCSRSSTEPADETTPKAKRPRLDERTTEAVEDEEAPTNENEDEEDAPTEEM